ncbi:MAG TPA: PHP domain-containing protein, partial [Thermodesulfobacteriota bacterium]|nr:PHP domain-containing protein [Thermodesulfobacteriota bacterium]
MLQEYRADLHIHTCLSPCASLDLTPMTIVRRALAERLNIIAVTDHNSAKNVHPVAQIGGQLGLKVVPGMEVQTREEVHLLALFPDEVSAERCGREFYGHLPEVMNDPETSGYQPVVNADEEILEFEEKLLINSLDLSIERVKGKVEEAGGLVIPSHVDKTAFSLISQLGFLPPDLKLDAVEVSRWARPAFLDEFARLYPSLSLIVSSDAHAPEEVGCAFT